MNQLTEQEVEIAGLMHAGTTDVELSRRYKRATKTFQRLRKKPHFAQFLEALDRPVKDRVQDAMASSVIHEKVTGVWNFNIADGKLAEVIDDPATKPSDRLKAIEMRLELWGIDKTMAPTAGTTDRVSGPDVYRAAWLNKVATTQ